MVTIRYVSELLAFACDINTAVVHEEKLVTVVRAHSRGGHRYVYSHRYV